jgi:purine-cytosine permease-like protein
MTLDHYLRHEVAFLERPRRWCLVWAVVALGAVLAIRRAERVLPDAVFIALLLLLVFGFFAGVIFIQRVVTRRFAERHGLLCPHCRHPYHAPLGRRAGTWIDMSTCRRCRGAVFAPDRQANPTPPPAAPAAAPSMTLDDYLGRESAFGEDQNRWMLAWIVVFFGGMVILVGIGVFLPNAVGAAISFIYVTVFPLGLYYFLDRAAKRALAERHGLLCPSCREPYRIPSGRQPGKLLQIPACRRCGGAVVEAGPGGLPTVRAEARDAGISQ